ncbi:MAG: response regulator [Acetobacteraceae bacterium]
MPATSDLSGLRILVVEDTLLVADTIVDGLELEGCSVVGPAPRVEPGLALARAEPLDGALLDVNLGGEACFPIAEALSQRGIPFMFLTGYGETVLPPAYRRVPRLTKPFSLDDLMEAMHSHFCKAA